MTKIISSPPVLAELCTDTTEAVNYTVFIRWKRKRTARAVQSNALPITSTEAMFLNPVLSTEYVPASHVKTKTVPASHVKSKNVPVSHVNRGSS